MHLLLSRRKLVFRLHLIAFVKLIVVYSEARMELSSARAQIRILITIAFKIDLTTLSKSATTLQKAIGSANVLCGALVFRAKGKACVLIADATF
jgi:hypothetical protein